MFRRYRNWERGEFVVVFCDTAWGGLDYCAGQFLSKTKLDLPLVFHSKILATEMTPQIHNELERIYDETGVKPVVAFERNNGGVAEIERLATLNRQGKYRIYQEKSNVGSMATTESSIRLGWTTSSATRPTMLSMLKEAIDNRLITIYDKPLINEMFSFIIYTTPASALNWVSRNTNFNNLVHFKSTDHRHFILRHSSARRSAFLFHHQHPHHIRHDPSAFQHRQAAVQ